MKLAFVAYPYLRSKMPTGKGYRTSAFQFWNALKTALPDDVIMARPEDGPAHPKVHLHYCPPHAFCAAPNKVNILFTMWEGPALPKAFIEGIKRADAIIVPSEATRETFEAAGVPVHSVIPLGVNPVFLAGGGYRPTLIDPTKPLTVLWAGSTALRKNWPEAPKIWMASGLAAHPGATLYVKTLDAKTETDPRIQVWPPNVQYDNRDLTDEQMAAVYGNAQIFLGTSLAEGFGLQPLEAMAMGALYVGPQTPGTEAFIDGSTAVLVPRAETVGAEYGGEVFPLMKASVEDMGIAIGMTVRGWGSGILEHKRRAGVERARSFLWTDTAARVYDVARN